MVTRRVRRLPRAAASLLARPVRRARRRLVGAAFRRGSPGWPRSGSECSATLSTDGGLKTNGRGLRPPGRGLQTSGSPLGPPQVGRRGDSLEPHVMMASRPSPSTGREGAAVAPPPLAPEGASRVAGIWVGAAASADIRVRGRGAPGATARLDAAEISLPNCPRKCAEFNFPGVLLEGVE